MSYLAFYRKENSFPHYSLKPKNKSRFEREKSEIWFCREFWSGNSRDGLHVNGEGYYYFKMLGEGKILKAYEYYETDEDEENSLEASELIGVNWFTYFGHNDDELLESVTEHEFEYVESLESDSQNKTLKSLANF